MVTSFSVVYRNQTYRHGLSSPRVRECVKAWNVTASPALSLPRLNIFPRAPRGLRGGVILCPYAICVSSRDGFRAHGDRRKRCVKPSLTQWFSQDTSLRRSLLPFSKKEIGQGQ
ncbi:hypothetical protein PPTG_22780 [Phytophthora nicotianae INRA-310]|uniref:Uncharacterized protein n=1 Tax=Phytophthora nicotianae (strain INRA-310) TaxID=761204 RepID=W2QB03_PHYN3|nr:hypothetical protein PPTG_22780 [Phytophthora nicotianae INRA-310]ETN10046.1 hypothetical protein PPTG_22780 [Phytophthora nicotianae INRA-310]